MTDRKADLLAWLREAHSMEAATIDNLERLIGRTDRYPRLKLQLQSHLEASRKQKAEIEEKTLRQVMRQCERDRSTCGRAKLEYDRLSILGVAEPKAVENVRCHAFGGLSFLNFRLLAELRAVGCAILAASALPPRRSKDAGTSGIEG